MSLPEPPATVQSVYDKCSQIDCSYECHESPSKFGRDECCMCKVCDSHDVCVQQISVLTIESDNKPVLNESQEEIRKIQLQDEELSR